MTYRHLWPKMPRCRFSVVCTSCNTCVSWHKSNEILATTIPSFRYYFRTPISTLCAACRRPKRIASPFWPHASTKRESLKRDRWWRLRVEMCGWTGLNMWFRWLFFFWEKCNSFFLLHQCPGSGLVWGKSGFGVEFWALWGWLKISI